MRLAYPAVRGKTPWWYLINLGRVFKEPRQGISLDLVKDSGPSAGGLGPDLAAGTDGDCISAQAVATGVPLAACCEIAMGVTMGYVLILML